MLKNGWALLGALLLITGCATRAKQTDALLASPGTLSPHHEIAAVPFVNQPDNFCGPATLVMAMKYAGRNATLAEVGGQTLTPQKAGTFQADMLGSARRQGMLVIPLYGMGPLLQEIEANHPVVVLQNLGLSWYPRWHYALAIGYDLKRERIRFYSGAERRKYLDMRKFERTWEFAKYWGMLVLPPGELAVSADELAHTGGAAMLEQAGHHEAAEKVYLSVLQRWPSSLTAYLGLGNTRFQAKDYKQSVTYLGRGSEAYPNSSVVFHNLAYAYDAAGERKMARASAAKAVKLAENQATLERYKASLASWLKPQ